LNLGGANGYVNLPNNLISVYTNVTIEAWLTWNGGGNWHRIFDFGSSSGGENNSGTGLTYFALTPQSSSGTLRFSVTTNSTGGQQLVAGPSALATGQPTHVAVVYNFVAGTAALFVNGQRVALGGITLPLNALNDINVWLGRSQWNDPYFNGSFDEVRIYNGALPDSAVAASFAAGPNALLGPLPDLAAQRSGGNVTLSWPLNTPGFTLQGATLVEGPWTNLSNPPAIQGNRLTVSLPITNASRFFRLIK
jgi:hypothetical protein